MLANNPSTMRFISTKLCRRFVADDPPKSLVDKCVETWKKTDGDIREILRTIVNSPEFFRREAFKSKVKSPFEYVISAVRALGGTVRAPAAPQFGQGFRPIGLGINVFAPSGNGQINPRLLAGQIGTLGQPLFDYGFPTGYPEDSKKWVSSGALIGRINFALSLVNGRIMDVDTGKATEIEDSLRGKPIAAQIDGVAAMLLGADLSPATRATLVKQLSTEAATGSPMLDDPKRIAALVLGSPEFQRR